MPIVKTWYRIRAARKSAEVRIYEEIGAWGVTANQFANDLAALGELQTIAVRINSPGGDVFDAMAIYNALQRHPARVVTHIDGLCASAATVVALAGDEIRMAENGTFMVHEPWTVTLGDAEHHQRNADLLDQIAGQIVDIYTRRSGMTAEAVRELMQSETWMTAAEALDAGFVDIVDEPLRIAAKVHDLSRFKNAPTQEVAMNTEIPADVPAVENPPAAADPETADSEEASQAEATAEIPGAEAARPVDAIVIARACLDARIPDLVPVLLAAPIDRAAMQDRIEQALEVRRLCLLAHQPDRAAELIRSGMTPDQAKIRLWDALVLSDRKIGEVDGTPPVKMMSRAEFEALSPARRRDFALSGGKITD